MKAVKTIVATAVIVFALTTVAMAGVQHLGGGAGANDRAQVATPQTAQQGDSVRLSTQQFAALLHAVSRGDARRLAAGKTGGVAQARAHAQAKTHARAQTHAAAHTQQATHHAETHHAQTHTGTHDNATHDDGSHAGTHEGGGHGGSCD
jgi:hypothetical protein